MTTYVPKGAGRPAAAERRERHAQRTPFKDRVELLATTDPYTRLQPGDEGTVVFVDDLGTLHVSWDSGSMLGLVPGEDQWKYTNREATP